MHILDELATIKLCCGLDNFDHILHANNIKIANCLDYPVWAQTLIYKYLSKTSPRQFAYNFAKSYVFHVHDIYVIIMDK